MNDRRRSGREGRAKPALVLLILSAGILAGARGSETGQAPVAIVGATLIDGNGGPAVPDCAVVVTGKRITEVGPRASARIPKGATILDGKGKFITPGFIDTNVHLSLYSAGETFVRYEGRNADLAFEAAQLHLKYGITTVRDGYGSLLPLVEVRDAINRGERTGPRILAAGNTVGWGGPYSPTFALTPEGGLTLFQEQIDDFFTQGSGQELLDIAGDELRAAIDRYLDRGPDFLKYGAAAHFEFPTLIAFSSDQQKIIVEEAHKRGKIVETHATSVESLRIAVLAGIDLLPHAEILSEPYPDDLVQLILDKHILCSVLSNALTGETWQDHLKARQGKATTSAVSEIVPGARAGESPRPRTMAERRKETAAREESRDRHRANARKLIRSGCPMAVSTNNYLGEAPEFRRAPKPDSFEAGKGTILAIEGLVELGLTPSQAIVAATKNGAIACRGLDQFGTIETGKLADLLVLEADPLAEIANIRRLSMIMRDGQIIDRNKLPEKPVWYGRPDGVPPSWPRTAIKEPGPPAGTGELNPDAGPRKIRD